MESTELRIGNLVRDSRDNCNINIIGEDFIIPNYINAYTEPLILTEEWLLKFGFKRWGKYTFYLGAIKIHHRKRGFVIAKRYQDIIYVHTLQNIVHSLTGKELTFKN